MMKMPGNFVDPFTNPIYRLPGDDTPSTTIDEDPTTQEATAVEESTPVRVSCSFKAYQVMGCVN